MDRRTQAVLLALHQTELEEERERLEQLDAAKRKGG